MSSLVFGNACGAITFRLSGETLPRRATIEPLEVRSLLAGDGLSAVYFPHGSSGAFTGAPATAIASTVDYNWNGASPATGIAGTNFSARFAGHVTATGSGVYTFRTQSDDGVRLWVDDKQIINNWTDHGNTTDNGTIALTAGQSYHIVLEYFQGVGGDNLNLLWQTPGSGSFEVIPQSQLSSDDKIFPSQAVINVKTAYGAYGDGVHDDWWAFQKAISDNLNSNAILYLPNGTYRVSKTLNWRLYNADQTPNAAAAFQGWGAWLSVQGENRDNTVIKLDNGVFTGGSSTGAVVYTASRDDGNRYANTGGAGNQAFDDSLYDLTIDANSSNAGATGIDYQGSNWAELNNVTVKSEDSANAAYGISMQRRDNGPLLIKNVLVQGFSTGISAIDGVGAFTFEHVKLFDQSSVGLYAGYGAVSARDLQTLNDPTAIQVRDIALLTLIDSNLSGGTSGQTAINNNANLFARNVTIGGYGTSLNNFGTTSTGNISEFTSQAPISPFAGTTGKSLNLAVKETPCYFDRNLNNWAYVGDPSGGDDTAAIQAALNSGKSTVYFKTGGRYNISNMLTIPATVTEVFGSGATLLPAASNSFGNAAAPTAIFKATGGASTGTLFFERFKNEITNPGAIGLLDDSPRTLVVKNTEVGGGIKSITNTINGGDIFVEDIVGGVQSTKAVNIWARQLNNESAGDPTNTNPGGNLWILGIKSEGNRSLITTTAGGKTELLGGLLYTVGSASNIAFSSINSQVSYTFGTTSFNDGNDYATFISDTQGGTTKTVTRSGAGVGGRGIGRVITLYSDAQPASQPTTPKPVNFDFGRHEVYSGAAVIGSSGDLWNGDDNGQPLKAADGTATSIAVHTTYNNAYGNINTSAPAHDLMDDFIYNGAGTVDFSGLDPTKTYDLYAYSNGDYGRSANFSVSTNPSDVHHLVQNPGLSSFVEGSNYVKISGFSPAANGTFTLIGQSTGGELDLNGFQLVAR